MALGLDRIAAAVLGATVFAFACGSSIVNPVLLVGRPARWVLLVVLLVVSAAYAYTVRPSRLPGIFLGLVAALGVLVIASTLWSVDALLTLKRGATFDALLVTGACLLAATAHDRDAVRKLLRAIVAAAVAVALVGLVVLAASWNDALQPATSAYPTRYRGFEQNPNTASMLLAVATPLAVVLALESRSRTGRLVSLVVIGVFAGSLAASGARGPMLAALAGTVVLVVVAGGPARRRLVLALVTCAVFASCIALSQIPQAKSAPSERRQHTVRVERRTLFTSSGRLSAWRGAIRQAGARPTAGYGFGTEQRVFVNRYAGFVSDLPENSYIGIALQTGIAGLLFVLAVVGGAAALFIHAVHRSGAERLLAACAGATVAALVVATTQSYLFAVGNIATVSAWVCVCLLAGASFGHVTTRVSSRSMSSSDTPISQSG